MSRIFSREVNIMVILVAFKNFTQLQETCPCFLLSFTFHLTSWSSISLFHWDLENYQHFFFFLSLSLSLSVACIFHSLSLLAQFLLPVTCSSLLNLMKPFFKPTTHWNTTLFYSSLFQASSLHGLFLLPSSVCPSTSPIYASTPNRQLSVELTCFWDWHCGHSLLFEAPRSLSSWDMLLSWYFSYFSDHSLSAFYAYTEGMVVHRT